MVRWNLSEQADQSDGELQSEQGSGPVDLEAGGGSSKRRPAKWSLGILNDKETDEVPGQLVAILGTKDTV